FDRFRRLHVFRIQLVFSDIAGQMKFVQDLQILQHFENVLKSVSPDLFGADTFEDCLCLFWIIPEIGLLGNQFFVCDLSALTIVVKDTSSRRQRVPSSLSTVLWSWSVALKSQI